MRIKTALGHAPRSKLTIKQKAMKARIKMSQKDSFIKTPVAGQGGIS
jgi:hypothetical protein